MRRNGGRYGPARLTLRSTSRRSRRPLSEFATLNERLIESFKSAGVVALDAYEKALQSLADFEQKVAKASQLDWVTALAATHAKFISDLSTSYTSAVRDQLK